MSLRDFEILSEIGEGAYSKVFKVLRLSDQEIYALKKVKIKSLKKKEKINALNEIRILASISHPNIISYKEAFFDDNSDSLCIVMEYADGGDLYQKILDSKKKQSYMSEAFLWHLLIKLTRALKALHELNIMHRDLKSANVFLTRDGKVKLGDLNVSKVAKEAMNHTQTGTPYYASPEVWKDDPYDVKSDIWSLGCVLYEAAALRPPFKAEDMKSLFKKVTKGVFPPLPTCYSQDFSEVLSFFIIVDAKKRPSASQILKLNLVNKRVNVKEESESICAGLIGTIKLPSNISSISQYLPGSKYSKSELNTSRTPLPQIVMINRLQRSDDEECQPHRNASRIEMPLRASPVLRRNYEALRLPRVKYPHKVNSMHEELLNKLVRRKEEILPLPIQERKIRRY
jgi:NIMA (never in mitosis gene a)-related kinase